ncbi:hypothetical protein HanIR_Chr03g0101001 [Helianthus annuus]|nr:hypothetical protein HanIR_Chr03g0101001 [Helianthus annuus]
MSVSAIVFPFAVALTSACAFLRISGFLISSTIAHSSTIEEVPVPPNIMSCNKLVSRYLY